MAEEETFRGQFLWVCDENGENCRNIPWKGTEDGLALIEMKQPIALNMFDESDLDEDNEINAPDGQFWNGCDVYNDGSSDLSFVLKNGTETVFTSFSLKSGESLENESFNKFNIIQFTGTDPKIRVLVRG